MGKYWGCLVCVPLLTGLLRAGPSPCVPGTLADYLAMQVDGCTVGSLLFSNFQFTATAHDRATPSPEAILVNPNTAPLVPGSPFGEPIPGAGFTFAVNDVVLPSRTSDGRWITPGAEMHIDYTVASDDRPFTRSALGANVSADILGTAQVIHRIADTSCQAVVNATTNSVADCSFDASSKVRVDDTIELRSGAAGGAGGHVGNVDVRFETPEPATWGMLAGGLGLLLLARKRLRN